MLTISKHFIPFLFLFFCTSYISAFDHTYKEYDKILQKYVCSDGVNYDELVKDHKFTSIDNEFQSVSLAQYNDFSETEKISFLINSYNFYTLLLIKNHYPTKSIMKIKKAWDIKFITLLGKKRSLNNIEHKLLRKNFDEPRIHFAVNCASIGCPALLNEAYIPPKLSQQLDLMALKFLKDESKNRVSGNTLYLSKIFDWYGKDFNSKFGNYKNYIYKILQLTGDYKVKFLEYDWDLNKAKCRK